MGKNTLTPKQEAFAVAVAEGMTFKEAYEAAGYSTNGAGRTTAENASKVARNPAVAARIAELRRPAAEAASVTLEGHLADMMRLRDRAEREGKYSAAVAAEAARAKAAGLLVDKVEHSGAINTGPTMRVCLTIKPDMLAAMIVRGEPLAVDLAAVAEAVAAGMRERGYIAGVNEAGGVEVCSE